MGGLGARVWDASRLVRSPAEGDGGGELRRRAVPVWGRYRADTFATAARAGMHWMVAWMQLWM